MQIIDGKEISNRVKQRVADEVLELKIKGITPTLAVVLVGEDKASQTYVASKERSTIAAHMGSVAHKLPETTTQSELLALIKLLNNDDSIDGILVQLPLPKHIDTNAILEAIDPNKDVDGFTDINVGRLHLNKKCLTPCTASGIIELINSTGEDIDGKHAVVIGRSNIVGKPVAEMLLNNQY